VARGIDVVALGHVINFDVPADPDAYIHRVGRTARADATGSAFTFVAPDEESDLRAIEGAIGKRLPRVTLPGFDYSRRTDERLEIPLRERLAQHRRNAAAGRKAPGTPRTSAGSGQRSRPPDREARARAILDRHAPAGEVAAAGPARSTRTRRRFGR